MRLQQPATQPATQPSSRRWPGATNARGRLAGYPYHLRGEADPLVAGAISRRRARRAGRVAASQGPWLISYRPCPRSTQHPSRTRSAWAASPLLTSGPPAPPARRTRRGPCRPVRPPLGPAVRPYLRVVAVPDRLDQQVTSGRPSNAYPSTSNTCLRHALHCPRRCPDACRRDPPAGSAEAGTRVAD